MKRIKARDFIGDTFGELKILDVIKKGERSYCICKCSCGVIKEVCFSNLRRGNTKTCGDRKKHPIHPPYLDLTGQKFGRLIALEKTEQRTTDRRVKWKCQCDCGNIVYVRSSYLTSGHTQSCGCLNSKGEEKISILLRSNNINFEIQRWFEDCRFPDTNYPARFDFYVNDKYIIEYDGIQHSKKIEFWEKNSEYTRKHDKIKTNWCLKNNIPLIRIPYTHYENLCIEDLLLETSSYIIKEVMYDTE